MPNDQFMPNNDKIVSNERPLFDHTIKMAVMPIQMASHPQFQASATQRDQLSPTRLSTLQQAMGNKIRNYNNPPNKNYAKYKLGDKIDKYRLVNEQFMILERFIDVSRVILSRY